MGSCTFKSAVAILLGGPRASLFYSCSRTPATGHRTQISSEHPLPRKEHHRRWEGEPGSLRDGLFPLTAGPISCTYHVRFRISTSSSPGYKKCRRPAWGPHGTVALREREPCALFTTRPTSPVPRPRVSRRAKISISLVSIRECVAMVGIE